MSSKKIPLIPLSLSLTTAACVDPIIGDWDCTRFCQEGYCLDMPYENNGYMTSISLQISEDLAGNWTQRLGYADNVDSDSTVINVVSEGGNQYKINFEEDTTSLDCGLDSSELDCTYSAIRFSFAKQ